MHIHEIKISLISYILLLFLFTPLTMASQVPNEKQVLKYIAEEAKKPKDQRNLAHIKIISQFLSQKAYDFAEKNPAFKKDVLIKKTNDSPAVEDLWVLGKNITLISLATFMHPYQYSGCLFVINQENPHWIPLKLERLGYSVITSYIDYCPPLLHIYGRSAGFYHGFGVSDEYVYQKGDFTLIRSVKSSPSVGYNPIQAIEKAEKMEKQIKITMPFISASVAELYSTFAKKGSPSLDKFESWHHIYFVKSDKAYFYEKPDQATKQNGYIVQGDAIFVSEHRDKWVFANYLNPSTKKTMQGFVRLEDLQQIK